MGSGSGTSTLGEGDGLATSERRMTRLEGTLLILISELVAVGGGTGLWHAGRGHIVYVGSGISIVQSLDLINHPFQ
jgi:hypothetical protein